MDDGIVFDTHRFIKRLVDTGMDERTAEVLADEQVNLLNGNLATKYDLAEVDARLQTKIAELDIRLQTKMTELDSRLQTKMAEVEARLTEVNLLTRQSIAELETRLLKWMVGLLMAQTGIVVTLIKII